MFLKSHHSHIYSTYYAYEMQLAVGKVDGNDRLLFYNPTFAYDNQHYRSAQVTYVDFAEACPMNVEVSSCTLHCSTTTFLCTVRHLAPLGVHYVHVGDRLEPPARATQSHQQGVQRRAEGRVHELYDIRAFTAQRYQRVEAQSVLGVYYNSIFYQFTNHCKGVPMRTMKAITATKTIWTVICLSSSGGGSLLAFSSPPSAVLEPITAGRNAKEGTLSIECTARTKEMKRTETALCRGGVQRKVRVQRGDSPFTEAHMVATMA